MSAFMLIQYTNSLVSMHIFSILSTHVVAVKVF